ncbi:MAG: hypothetical protein IK078_02090 [Lachnospiraceae bacterium]|nr:hypothetical protein [Lachnospiraceae bacterium]
MKRIVMIILTSLMVFGLTGCIKDDSTAIIEDEDDQAPVVTALSSEADEDADADVAEDKQARIDDTQALTAIKNYCYINMPGLKDIEDSGKGTVYWDISSSDKNEIVVMFRSYTGAQVRYYIDSATGDTFVTESVPEISDEEKKTDEHFNVRDFSDGEIVNVYEVTDSELSEEYMAEGKYVTIVRYFEMADGTWKTKFNSYNYRLEITGQADGMEKECTLVYLSNIEDIPFEQAYKAAGVSSSYEINNEDCFDQKDAVLVAMKW